MANSENAGHEDGFFNKDSVQTLCFYKIIMKLTLGLDCYNDLLTTLASYFGQTDYEKIKSLKIIAAFFDGNDLKALETKYIVSLLQYASTMSFNDKQPIRYYSAHSLVNVVGKLQYDDLVIDHLARMMDTESSDMKIHIVNAVKAMSSDYNEYKKFIFQKARVDNHYLVRKAVADM